MEYTFSTLIDIEKTQALLMSFAKATGVPSTSIIGLDKKVLVGGTWGRVCEVFHHKHPICHQKCLDSDAHITEQLSQQREIYCYRCPNGLYDAASPIFLEGKHVANCFAGQFLLKPPDIAFFRKQAAQYGFDEKEYLNAVANIPVISEEKLGPILEFLVTFAQMLGEISLNRIHELQTAEELKTTEKRFEDILTFLEQIVWSTYKDGTEELHTHVAAEKIYGRSADEFLCNGHLNLDTIHPDDRDQFLKARDIVMESGAYEFDFRIIQRDGTLRWLNNRARLVRDAAGEPLRIDGIATDITDRKQAEQEKRELEMELQHAQKLESLGVMAGGIAHDFNNLLTVIRGNAELLAEQLTLDTEQKAALRNIQTAASYAGAMTRALQAFSRPSRPEFHTVDANILVRDTHNLLRRVLPAMIAFKTRFETEPCTINADPAQIQQVLINLCVNARDAMPNGGTLSIETRLVSTDALPPQIEGKFSSNRYVQIHIKDTGCGMDSGTLKNMFDPFFTTKPKDLGTGLGLAIVYRIIQAHEGVINVVSEPEKGTCIDMFFPAVEQPQTDGLSGQSPITARRGRILVVDDEEMIASLLQTVLESLGHKVLIATQPEDAIALAYSFEQPLDLAIVDYELPRKSGIECVEAIRQRHSDLKAIVITGHGLDTTQPIPPNIRIMHKPFSTGFIAQMVQEELKANDETT